MNGSSISGRLPPGCLLASDSFMSSPAQKPRPLPVKIATSSSLLWRNSVHALASWVRISWLSALSRSGRFIRTTRICPWRSFSTTGMVCSLGVQFGHLMKTSVGCARVSSRRAPSARLRYLEAGAAFDVFDDRGQVLVRRALVHRVLEHEPRRLADPHRHPQFLALRDSEVDVLHQD